MKIVANGNIFASLSGIACGRFTAASIRWGRYANGMKSYAQRLKEAGVFTSQQIGAQFGVSERTVINWRKKGLTQGCVMIEINGCIFNLHALYKYIRE